MCLFDFVRRSSESGSVRLFKNACLCVVQFGGNFTLSFFTERDHSFPFLSHIPVGLFHRSIPNGFASVHVFENASPCGTRFGISSTLAFFAELGYIHICHVLLVDSLQTGLVAVACLKMLVYVDQACLRAMFLVCKCFRACLGVSQPLRAPLGVLPAFFCHLPACPGV